MTTNILRAIKTVVENNISDVASFYQSNNRINSAGDALELFVKDIFANTVNESDISKKQEIYQNYFSYFGNASNPPDLMIIGGDAVEVKKIESQKAQIALNSSYPSAKLYADSPMITQTCRTCEEWTEKDLIYVIGTIKNNKLSLLWFVYGDCYAASRETYEKIKAKIAQGVREIQEVEFSETRELGRVNKVDPLEITYLRIRGMWGIENPSKVYKYLDTNHQLTKKLHIFALMRENKYLSFPATDRESLELLQDENFSIKSVKIKSPDNPVKLIPAKLITYQT